MIDKVLQQKPNKFYELEVAKIDDIHNTTLIVEIQALSEDDAVKRINSFYEKNQQEYRVTTVKQL